MTNKAGGPGRKLGLFAAIALVMGNMIGSGVFLLPASLAPFGWNAVAAWIATISGALVLAYVLARLTKAFPEAGGPTGFVQEAFGSVAAFLIGWVFLVSIWTGVVTIAVAAISYLSSMVPGIADAPLRPAILAAITVWLLTLLNLRGVKAAGNFQVVTVLIKIIPLVVVIIIAAALLGGGTGEIAPFKPETISLTAINGAAALTLWALLGFECASVATARVENAPVNVPRATMWGTALTGLLYLLVCSAIALMLPAEIASRSPAPFATFVERYWAPGPAALIAVFAVVSCVGALNGWMIMVGELPRTMAEKGMLPAWFGVTDSNGTPRRALLVSAVIATVLVMMNASRTMQELFEFLLLLSTSANLWLYLACAMAAVRLKVALPFAFVGIAYSLWTLWGAGLDASGLSLVLMLAGLPLYWWAKKDRKVAAL
ncbi:amino acid permease [Altererythrobacter confluentis]|uniref:Arginine/agmatine antiporter n=1 Tax=Allopontixanthobacter confluentis TaxID=1849021 RepID=A0A6L7GIA5_9SPHN|nr:amino acid permease [Allopontixanthobacter confluentis]MXP15667.1 amino acid permease [Allopontixanthobacter confluentis]